MISKSTPLHIFVAKRLVQAVPVFFAIIIIAFYLIYLSPGDPIQAHVGDFAISDEYRQEITEKYGLDDPFLTQLGVYFKHMAKGDLGYSYKNKQPVITIIRSRLGATFLLMAAAALISTVVGITLGMIAANRHNSFIDNLIMLLSISGYSVPVFWLGQLMIVFIALNIDWLPIQGMRSVRLIGVTGWPLYLDYLRHLILPSLCLSFTYLAINARMTRANMLETFRKDYVITAYAKGLKKNIILLRHVLRNALIPVITIIGFNLGYMLFGSVLVEIVFGWPGIGRLIYESVTTQDTPVLLGVFLVASFTVVIINIIVDAIYGYLDPRTRY